MIGWWLAAFLRSCCSLVCACRNRKSKALPGFPVIHNSETNANICHPWTDSPVTGRIGLTNGNPGGKKSTIRIYDLGGRRFYCPYV